MNSLQGRSDTSQRRLEFLRPVEPDLVDAVLWLRQNQALFQQPVLEPPIVALTVKGHEYLDAIEACFSASQLRVREALLRCSMFYNPFQSFVAQNKADYDLLTSLVVDDTRALGRKGRIDTVCIVPAHSDRRQPFVDRAQVKSRDVRVIYNLLIEI